MNARHSFIARLIAWLMYPLLILFGLRFAEPRHVALILLLCLLMRRGRQAARLLVGLSRLEWITFSALLILAGAAAMTNSEALLRFYPLAVNLGLLALFGMSLRFPPSMIERFARLREPHLPHAAIGYTRRVTQVWCVFFVCNGILAAWTALYADRETWALYNGFIAYLLMGTLLGGEWLIRRFWIQR